MEHLLSLDEQNLIMLTNPQLQSDYIYVDFGSQNVTKPSDATTYEDERYQAFLKGTIYNIQNLYYKFTGQEKNTTTNEMESVVELYSLIGEEIITMLRGKFVIIIWDKEKEEIFGARDPYGINQLYYVEEHERTYFATEKKVILAHDIQSHVDFHALQHYMTYQYVPEPQTMDDKIKMIEPGHYFIKKAGQPIETYRYWQAQFQPIQAAEEECISKIRDVLFDTVQLYMQGSSPGTFLSGGIDSTYITALAKQINPQLKSFTVGFEREGFSEIDVAEETAMKLGVDHYSYTITPEEYMKELPKIIWHMDDPLADPACVPLYFVAREAKKQVNSVLSGEGADELFGGYNIYREPISLSVFNKIPSIFKKFLRVLAQILPEGVKGKSFIERGVTPLEERYIGNAKMFEEREKQQLLLKYNHQLDYRDITKPLYMNTTQYGPVEKMQYIDIHTWLRGDILLKADKMANAHNLDVRMPFLDMEVFNIAAKISADLKTAGGTTKYILRKAAEGIIPNHVLDRKKLGFPVPIRHWLRNEMYDWAMELIQNSQTDDIINKSYVKSLLDIHYSGKRDLSRKIWTVLIFMIWHSVFIEKEYDFSFTKEYDGVRK